MEATFCSKETCRLYIGSLYGSGASVRINHLIHCLETSSLNMDPLCNFLFHIFRDILAMTSEPKQNTIVEMEKKMADIERMNIEEHVKSAEARMANMQVAMATSASSWLRSAGGAEKNPFHKEVLESKAIANIGKFSTLANIACGRTNSRTHMGKPDYMRKR